MAYNPGPFDSAHLYVQFGGKLPGAETWTCGFRLSGPAPATDAAAVMANVAPLVKNMYIAVPSSSRAQLSYVKVNAIGTDGKYISPLTNETLYADLPGAGVAGNTPANQVAIAVSLLTGFSRGPAHRGRFFLPLPCTPVETDGRITAANALLFDGPVETMITAINATTPDYNVGVYSRKLGAPSHRLVTGAAVGRVLDTQRRRRRALVEAY